MKRFNVKMALHTFDIHYVKKWWFYDWNKIDVFDLIECIEIENFS